MALFILIFAAFGMGQAQAFGPDMGKAAKSANKIFGYIDAGSRINPLDIPSTAGEMNFQGKIEFKNVWFRYPAKPTQWVLKGLNLCIEQNQSVALVGESGAGKSTIVGLVLRYYDADFGEILIDGVNIKNISVKNLRE